VRKYLSLILVAGSFIVSGCAERRYEPRYGYSDYGYQDGSYRDYRYGRRVDPRVNRQRRAEEIRRYRHLRRIEREQQRERWRSRGYHRR
jgi:hypothetical protein